MNCATENVIYLISCIQYIGETSQKLRNRMNNHRNRLRNLTNLYLYQHFNSDGHSEEDHSIMIRVHVLKGWKERTIGVESCAPFTLMG